MTCFSLLFFLFFCQYSSSFTNGKMSPVSNGVKFFFTTLDSKKIIPIY